jgi:hypothetical protein
MTNRQASDDFHFAGFGRPKSNYFKMPKEWTNLTAKMNSLAEVKVVEYVLKHTWGYQEFGIAKKITTDEFINGRRRKDGSRMDDGTGLDAKSVRSGLQKAVEHGLIIEEVNDSDLGRIKKYYLIRMSVESSEEIEAEEGEVDEAEISRQIGKVSPSEQIGKISPPDRESFHARGGNFRERTEKDTLERYFKKDTDNSKFEGAQPLKENGAQTAAEEPAEQGESRSNGRDQGTKRVYSQQIASVLTDFSRHILNDPEHTPSNVTRATNLWDKSGLGEEEFVALLYEAKEKTLSHSGSIKKTANGFRGTKNRAPYFFGVLEDLVKQARVKQIRSGFPKSIELGF